MGLIPSRSTAATVTANGKIWTLPTQLHQFPVMKLYFRWQRPVNHYNPLTPNDHYSGRTAPLNSKVVFYIFIQQI